MDLHEFQAKELLERFGIDTPGGRVVESVADAQRAAEGLGGRDLVVKAQIRAGDRARHGGVRFADSPRTAAAIRSVIDPPGRKPPADAHG